MPKPASLTTDIVTLARAAFAGEDAELLQQLTPLLDAAGQGDQKARDVFVKSVGSDGTVNYPQLLRLLAGLASSAHTGIDPTPPRAKTLPPRDEIKLPPHITRKEALKRAEELDVVRMMPADAEETIFNGMEYAMDERIEGKTVRILDEVRAFMAERMGRTIIKASANARALGAGPVPPPAGETYDAYRTSIMHLLEMDEETLEAWLAWPHWQSVLAFQFIDLLMNVRETGTSRSNAKRLEDALDLKWRWYQALGINGVDDYDLMKAVNTLYPDTRTDAGIKALAELARFAKPDDDSLMRHPSSARLLASAIDMVHAAAPFLRESRFLKLLPPFVHPMTMEGAMEMLNPQGRRGEASTLFRAQAMLMLHTPASQEQLDAIVRLVNDAGGKFKTFEDFCQSMLGLTPHDLGSKIAEHEGEGLSVRQLTGDIERIFPGKLTLGHGTAHQDEDAAEMAAATAAAATSSSAQLALGAAATMAAAIKPGTGR